MHSMSDEYLAEDLRREYSNLKWEIYTYPQSGCPESDWKLFQKWGLIWQENYMERWMKIN